MKALEILKDIQDSKWCGVKPTLVNWKLEDFNEAIKELEDLENRSCENCKFKYVVDSMCTECRCNESPIDYIDFDCFPFFSCNKWKSKK